MVSAESYLQHAEHYNRIIMAAQTQFSGQPNAQQGEGPNGGGSYRNPRWNSDDEGIDDDVNEGGGGRSAPKAAATMFAKAAGVRTASVMPATASTIRGGRDRNRHGGNGHEGGREQNGADQPEAAPPDETAHRPGELKVFAAF